MEVWVCMKEEGDNSTVLCVSPEWQMCVGRVIEYCGKDSGLFSPEQVQRNAAHVLEFPHEILRRFRPEDLKETDTLWLPKGPPGWTVVFTITKHELLEAK